MTRYPTPTRLQFAGATLAMALVVLASNILVQFAINDWLTWGAFSYPVAFLVSDFLASGYEQPLRLAGRRHDAGRRGDPHRLLRPVPPRARLPRVRRAGPDRVAGRGVPKSPRHEPPRPGTLVGMSTHSTPTVWPAFRARDARVLIRFLVDAFGFEETVVYGDQPDGSGDVVVHAELAWPLGGGIMLGSERDDPGNPWRLSAGTFGAYVVADDIEDLHARAVAAGAEIVRSPFTTDYGSHDFTARDPEGNLWQFGTYRGEPRKATGD
jgi:uncharacterized glyoxalase superfamily protein PhnB